MNLREIGRKLEKPFTFAVVGDTHFLHSKFGQPAGDTGGSFRPLQVDQYLESVQYVLMPMMASLKAASPAFLVITGDLVEGHQDVELAFDEIKEGLEFFEGYGIPLLFACGNRDRVEAFDGVVRPYLGRWLGRTPHERFFFLDVAGCRLIFLDTPSWTRKGAQREWLELTLNGREAAGIDRTFLFGHHPVWPLARAFFTNLDLHLDLPEILQEHPVDAFFCGHTHNQNVLLHRTNGRPVLQCMCASIGLSSEMPTPLDRVQDLLPYPRDVLTCWPGYLENTAPGWFIVNVGRTSVEASWHHLNRGVETRLVWHRPGDLSAFEKMDHPPDARLIYDDLSHIRRASLRFCGWHALRQDKQIFLNGMPVGSLPPANDYAPIRMDLPAECLEHLRMENRLEIQVPRNEACTLGNFLLEAVLPGGRFVRTRPTGEIFTWSDRWGAWNSSFLMKMKPGRPATTLLCFQ